jgi:hypothetical protein
MIAFFNLVGIAFVFLLLLTLVALLCFCLVLLSKIDQSVEKMVLLLSPKEAAAIEFYAVENGQSRKVTKMKMQANQKLKVSIKIKDKFGNEAKVDGVPAWSQMDDSKGSLVASEDGMSAEFSPSGPVGTNEIKVSCDADLGEGVKPLEGKLEIEIEAGQAEVLEINAEISI